MDNLEFDFEIPPLAKWKAMLLAHGVTMRNPHVFSRLPNADQARMKYRILQPVARGLKVYDESTDTSIIPSEVILRYDGRSTLTKLGYRSESPLLLDVDGSSLVLIDRSTNQLLPIELNLVPKSVLETNTLPISMDPAQPKLSEFVALLGLDRIRVMTFDGCWNWNSKHPCKFCDFLPKRPDMSDVVPSLNTLADYDLDINRWWNAQRDRYLAGVEYAFRFLIDHQDIGPHKHLLLMSGNAPTSEATWRITLEVLAHLSRIAPLKDFDSYVNLSPHPDLSFLEAVKRLGARQVQYHLEVFGEDLFLEMCPGKTNYCRFVECLEEAVSVMGFGNVRTQFVFGLQPSDELLEGIRLLSSKGIVSDFSVFQPKRGTPLATLPSPSMHEIIRFCKALAAVYKEHGFRPLFCGLSSRSSIIHEFL